VDEMSSESFSKVINLDLKNFTMTPATRKREVRLSELKDYFSDPAAANKILSSGRDPVVYEYYEYVVDESAGHLSLGLTIIYPGKVGKEYFMTRGHFHLKPAAEFYYGIRGRGMLLIQSEDGRAEYVELRPGVIGYVPPGWGHRTINTGRGKFVFFFAYPSDAGHDYGIVKEKGFAKIVIEEKGKPKVVDNPKYVSSTI
jgi:glucose-6-phosphate isomerase